MFFLITINLMFLKKQLRSFQVIVVKLLMNLTGINIIFL